MTGATRVSWAAMPEAVRTVGRWLTILQVIGYTTSLLFIYQTTAMSPSGVEGRYRGIEDAAGTDAMQFPKSLDEMLTVTHTHLLSMAAIFAFSGLALALCARPAERWRRLLIAEPFAALVVSFTAMWLMRYVDPRFSLLLMLSSGVMAATFYAQSFFVLRELLAKRSPR